MATIINCDAVLMMIMMMIMMMVHANHEYAGGDDD